MTDVFRLEHTEPTLDVTTRITDITEKIEILGDGRRPEYNTIRPFRQSHFGTRVIEIDEP